MTVQAPRSKPAAKPHHRTAMGQEQRAKMRAKIIDAAIHVFVKKGSYAPVIDDFVQKASISRGTFYYYFSTVTEVREAAVACVIEEFIAENFPMVEKFANPILRFAIAARLYQRRARLDPFFAEFVSSTTNMGSLISSNTRRDLQQAIEQGLVKARDIDSAYLIAIAVGQYGARYFSQRPHGPLRAPDFVRATLRAWGVDESLIEEALALKLPQVRAVRYTGR
jgi:AcrR family transcriptional regulator